MANINAVQVLKKYPFGFKMWGNVSSKDSDINLNFKIFSLGILEDFSCLELGLLAKYQNLRNAI